MTDISLEAQYHALKKSPELVDLCEEEIFELSGPDHVEFLNNYNSQDIKSLRDFQTALGTFQNQKGKLISDSIILKLPEKILLIFEPGFGAKVEKHLDVYLGLSESQLRNVSSEWCRLAILGKGSENALGEIFGRKFSSEPKNEIGSLELSGQSFLIFPTEQFGIPGWEILGQKESAALIVEKFHIGKTPCLNPQLLEVLRVEAGYPKMGIDMTEENLVAEVGLDQRAVSFNKGCYLGQETTARVNTQGHVNKKIIQLKLEKPISKNPPFEIRQGDKSVGKVTSLVDSIKMQSPLALALVQTKAIESGDPLVVEAPEGKIKAVPLS